MSLVSPAQIRAARAFLDWTMLDLANRANVSVSTIKRYEDGQGAPASVGMIQDALEAAGIRFLEDDGTGLGLRFVERRTAFDADGQSLPSASCIPA